MTLDVRSASVLIECARLGSLGRAAQSLDLTQPAVTRIVKRLEDSYRVSLFDRTTRGVVLTIYGEALLPYAKLVVSEIANAGDLIEQMRGASRGVVRVGGVSSAIVAFLMGAVARMRHEMPDVQFQIVDELEDRLLDALKSGEIDLALSPEPYADDEITLAAPDSFSDLVLVFARAEHPILAAKEIGLADVANLDWALPPPETPVVREWLRRFHAAAIEPRRPAIVSRSVHVIRSSVLHEDMLCWMPAPLFGEQVAAGTIVPVPVPQLSWRRVFRIYRRAQGLMPPSATLLVEKMQEVAEQEAGKSD